MSKTEAKKQTKGDLKPSPFIESISGEIRTLNTFADTNDKVTGARGQIKLTADSIKAIESLGFKVEEDTAIYKITYEKISEWTGAEELQISDIATMGSIYITTYKGNVQDWKGLLYLSLCANGLVEVKKGERKTNGKFRPKSFFKPKSTPQQPSQEQPKKRIEPITKPKIVGTDMQLLETLLAKIDQAQEALKKLESIATVGDVVSINSKDFHKLSTDVTLSYNRMYSTILHILGG